MDIFILELYVLGLLFSLVVNVGLCCSLILVIRLYIGRFWFYVYFGLINCNCDLELWRFRGSFNRRLWCW